MTVAEMHYDFLLKKDAVDSLKKREYLPHEIDWLLNEAQRNFIHQRTSGMNATRTSFEETQKRIADLSNIHVKFPTQPGIAPTDLGDGIYELPLSSLSKPYYLMTRIYATIEDDCLDVNGFPKLKERVNIRPMESDDLTIALDDPFNKPSRDEILGNYGLSTQSNSTSLFIYSSLPVTSVFPEYLTIPRRINIGGYAYIDGVTYPVQDCLLSIHTHPDIVDIAVLIASGVIEASSRYQVAAQKTMQND